MSPRFLAFTLAMIAVVVMTGSVAAQIGAAEIAIEGGRYYQAESLRDVNYSDCPYTSYQPGANNFKTFNQWMSTHSTQDGMIIRAPSIDFATIEFLNVFLGNNDCVGLWHQVFLYGPITDFLTLSKIRVVSLTSETAATDPKPAWCISENEALMIMSYVALKNGTYNNKWPYLDE